jgi:hypothetical protein
MSPSTALSEARHVLEPYLSDDNTLNSLNTLNTTTIHHRSTHQRPHHNVTNRSDIDRAVKVLFKGLVMWARIARSIACISSPESSVVSELMDEDADEDDEDLQGRGALVVGRARSIKGKNRDQGFVLTHSKLDMPTLVSSRHHHSSTIWQLGRRTLNLISFQTHHLPTQNELLFLLVKLHHQGLLEKTSDVDPDSDSSNRRRRLINLRLIGVISEQLRNIAQTPMTTSYHEASKMSCLYLVSLAFRSVWVSLIVHLHDLQ